MEGMAPGAETALRAHFSEVETCCLDVRCHTCGGTTIIPFRMLVTKYGRDKQVGALVSRLSCKRCSLPPTTVTLKEKLTDYKNVPPGWKWLLIDRTPSAVDLAQAEARRPM